MGGHQREGREAKGLGEVAFVTMQSAGRSGALNTGRHALEAPATGGGAKGGGSGVRVRVGGEGGSRRPLLF